MMIIIIIPCADSTVACLSRVVIIRYRASEERKCVNNELEKIWKEPVVFKIQQNLSKQAEENKNLSRQVDLLGEIRPGGLNK